MYNNPLAGGFMNITGAQQIIQSFEKSIGGYMEKCEKGQLSMQDLKELDHLVSSLKSQIPSLSTESLEKTGLDSSVSTTLEGIESELLSRVDALKEKNFGMQRAKLQEAVFEGVIHFEDLQGSSLPFNEKMEILLKANKNSLGNVELLIVSVPDKNKAPSGELRLVIKPDPIVDSDGMVLSQINEPTYRESLLQNRDKAHYSFEFFDQGRLPEIDRAMKALRDEKEALDTLGGLLENYFVDLDEEAFNAALTPAQRALFDIPEGEQLDESAIGKLYQSHQEKSFMFPIEEDSIKSGFEKATIRGRFCEDGSIGELKSVNIHTEHLGGKELMDFWDSFCSYMEPSQIYLEDDAKIEGSTGSYNLRLFRLMALNGRGSWYTDSWQYQLYKKDSGQQIETLHEGKAELLKEIAPIKQLTLNHTVELLQKPGMGNKRETIELIQRFISKEDFGGEKTLGDLVKHLGNEVMANKAPLHKDLDRLLDIVATLAKYEGSDLELLQLKEHAEPLAEARFYRKSYV